MPRPDERDRRRPRGDANANGPDAAAADGPPPSKTRRKAEMHALQDMGEALVGLDPKRLAELAAEAALPTRLVDAIVEARSITAWGARKRQLQYVGRLMRDVDPEPDPAPARSVGARSRDRHGAPARARAMARPAASRNRRRSICLRPTRPRLDRPRFRALIARARDERAAANRRTRFASCFAS